LVFAPPGWTDDLYDFCIPPLVVREEEWQEYRAAERERGPESSGPLQDHGYLPPTRELLLSGGTCRPVLLSALLDLAEQERPTQRPDPAPPSPAGTTTSCSSQYFKSRTRQYHFNSSTPAPTVTVSEYAWSTLPWQPADVPSQEMPAKPTGAKPPP